jgi:acetyl esterase
LVSVDYRLAPEHKFPAAVEDAWDAVTWVRLHGAGLGLDPERIAVGGDSAGGNLAAVAALLARDAGLTLRYQLLIYPATDFAELTDSQRLLADGYMLTRANQDWFRNQYLRDAADLADWRASPLRAATLKHLPPAFLVTAGYDPLADEGNAYADRLEAEGVSVTRRHFPGQIHGFLTMGGLIEASGIAIAESGAVLKAAFAS